MCTHLVHIRTVYAFARALATVTSRDSPCGYYMKGCINYVVALMVETMAKQEFSTAKCYRVGTSTWE